MPACPGTGSSRGTWRCWTRCRSRSRTASSPTRSGSTTTACQYPSRSSRTASSCARQRATLQYWKEDVPWAAKGSVSVANGGDLAKEAGLFPMAGSDPRQRTSLIVTVLDEASTHRRVCWSRSPADAPAGRGRRRRRRLAPTAPGSCSRPGRPDCRCAASEPRREHRPWSQSGHRHRATGDLIAVTDAGVRLERRLARAARSLQWTLDVDVVSGFFKADRLHDVRARHGRNRAASRVGRERGDVSAVEPLGALPPRRLGAGRRLPGMARLL